jgi:hypothetical protein
MAGQFVVTRNGRDSFCDEDELKALASRGQLSPADLVYHPVLGRWLYAREVEEVKAELAKAARLGVPTVDGEPPPTNGAAIAGFVLGVLGHLPVVGLIACILGIYFSQLGMRRASSLGNRGHGLAVAGMVLSIVFIVPATACTAVIVSAALS